MKRIVRAFVLCILICAIAVIPTFAESVDTERVSSLRICLIYGGEPVTGADIDVYFIASVGADGRYTAEGAFKDYPVKLDGITTVAQWDTVLSTYEAYIAADNIAPAKSASANENGEVLFSDLTPGLYLTAGTKCDTDEGTVVYESFLTVIPQPDGDSYNYDVTAHPKCENFTPFPGERGFKVVKQWRDRGYEEKRPDHIVVDIIKDGKVESTERLTAENNWSYSWTAPDDGAVWTAVERQISDDYTVSITVKGETVVITNTYAGEAPPPPQTGDTRVLWPYILMLGASGGIMIAVAVWRRRTEE